MNNVFITKLVVVCLGEALINGMDPIRDNQLSASSVADSNHGPSRSRLHTKEEGGQAGSWSAGSNTNTQWIQVKNNNTQTHSGFRYTTTTHKHTVD